MPQHERYIVIHLCHGTGEDHNDPHCEQRDCELQRRERPQNPLDGRPDGGWARRSASSLGEP